MIFPKVKNYKETNGKFVIEKKLTVSFSDEKFSGGYEFLKKLLGLLYEIECEKVDTNADVLFEDADYSAEEYSLNIANNAILICASDYRGAIYAAGTLAGLIKNDGEFYIPSAEISDGAYTEIRGIHFYMPAKEQIEDFKRLIDFMTLVKMNTVILEVGGGMEYERHPEINEAWVNFCKTINNFPGLNGYKSFQGSDFYWKDSLHTELCGGSFLKKSEVRELVEYCKSRGMDVIPEIQALSHCYYLTIAHPEIAELSDDPFPDTYCPNNEKSYELYFDVADEVLEVFEPTTISIGHDEIRVLGWCDKCKDKSGAELVGNDILKLHEFYAKRGVRIAMWAESAQTFESFKGAMVGDKDVERTDEFGRYYKLPKTHECLDMLPNDILMLDWYHSMGHDSEDCFDKRDFDVIYGNFHGMLFGDWDRRSARGCIRGAEVSSWCPATEEIFASDGITFEAMFSSYILWADDYCNDKYDEVCDAIREFMPIVRTVCKGERSPLLLGEKVTPIYRGTEAKNYTKIDLNAASFPSTSLKNALSGFGDELYGAPVHTGTIIVRDKFKAERLLFLHNCNAEMNFYPSHYFTDKNSRGIAAYAVCYDDGTVVTANVYYGVEIGVKDFTLERYRDASEKLGVEIDAELEEGKKQAIPCYYTMKNQWVESLTYNATPIIGKDATLFCFEWKNPHPDKEIVKIKPYNIATDFKNKNDSQEIYLYGIGAI